MKNSEEKEPDEAQEGPLQVLSSIASNKLDDDDDNNINNNNNNSAVASPPASIKENTEEPEKTPVQLYKSSRLKGYITLALSSFINYDAARKSGNVTVNILTVVPSTDDQRRYAMAVAVVSMTLATFCLVTHLDRVTPLEKIWVAAFRPGSKVEGALATFLTLWWTVATGVNTSVNGIAGDGKGQYSLYYSTWACCWTSYWVLERWWVAAGWSSLESFIASWPNRAPAWICIMVVSFATLIWYLDLWQNHTKLNTGQGLLIKLHFNAIGHGEWQWFIIVCVFTFCPSLVFILIELFRETKADGSNTTKSNTEVFVEGICFLTLVAAWIPTVMIATTPKGAASLIGNAYFFTWLTTIVVFEGFMWFIHDRRKETHLALKEKEEEYLQRQRDVLEQTKAIQRKHEEEEYVPAEESESARKDELSSEFFDAAEEQQESRARFAT